MRKITFFVLSVLITLNMWAQPAGHFASPMTPPQVMTSSGAKNDYQWKLTSFYTDDYYQICTFSYDADHRLLAMTDPIFGEYLLIDYTYNAAYDAQNQLALTTLDFAGMLYQKIGYEYAGNDCVQEMWYSYNFDTGTLLPSEKIVTNYVDGRKVLRLDSIIGDGIYWQYNGKSTYQFDSLGNCTEYHLYDHELRGGAQCLYLRLRQAAQQHGDPVEPGDGSSADVRQRGCLHVRNLVQGEKVKVLVG